MFKKHRRAVKEKFDVGKLNLDNVDYEIKLTGAASPTYAQAINDRRKLKDKLEDDFKEKNELQDEFVKEQSRVEESLTSKDQNLISKADSIAIELDELIAQMGEIPSIEGFVTADEFKTLNDTVTILNEFIVLYGPGVDIFSESVKSKSKFIKESSNNADSLMQEMRKEGLEFFTPDDLLKESDQPTKFEMKKSGCQLGVFSPKLHKKWLFKDKEELVEFFNKGGQLDPNNAGRFLKEDALAAVDMTLRSTAEDEPLEFPKKRRVRSSNTRKEDKLYSSDDLYLKVYDELSSEVKNEGPNKEINKELNAPAKIRYQGPFAGPGDYDLYVDASSLADLDWARKVANHYGVKMDIEKSSASTGRSKNYPYRAIFRNLK